ncbi:MAG: GNAT family N-acetyltransferase [Candidatus Nanopelagicales bacterium]
MTELVVRPARTEDLPDVGMVRALTWQAAYAGMVDDAELRTLTDPDVVAAWAARAETLTLTGSTYAVADLDGTVVGFAAYGAERSDSPRPWRGELYALYVLPEHWRTGAGSALMHHALDELAENGFDHATLLVLAGNDRAISFYRRHGFHETGEVLRDHRGLDDLRMARTLGPRGDLAP